VTYQGERPVALSGHGDGSVLAKAVGMELGDTAQLATDPAGVPAGTGKP
jgi:hypothetical protein